MGGINPFDAAFNQEKGNLQQPEQEDNPFEQQFKTSLLERIVSESLSRIQTTDTDVLNFVGSAGSRMRTLVPAARFVGGERVFPEPPRDLNELIARGVALESGEITAFDITQRPNEIRSIRIPLRSFSREDEAGEAIREAEGLGSTLIDMASDVSSIGFGIAREFSDFSEFLIKKPGTVLSSFVLAPFMIGWNAGKVLSADLDAVPGIGKVAERAGLTDLHDLSPEEYRQYSNGLSAFMLSLVLFPAGARIGTKGLSTLKRIQGVVPDEAGSVLTARQQILAEGTVGGVAAGLPFGVFEGRNEEEKIRKAISFAVAGIPIGFAIDGLASYGMLRGSVGLGDISQRQRILAQQREVRPQDGLLQFDNIVPIIDETGDVTTQYITRSVPGEQEAAARMQTYIESFGDVGESIISGILVGLDGPGKTGVIPQLSREQMVNLSGKFSSLVSERDDIVILQHARKDGSFDVAIGHKDSPLANSREMFIREGFYNNERVSYNGNEYLYQGRTPKGKRARLRAPDGKLIRVSPNNVRRIPTQTDSNRGLINSVEETSRLLAEVLDADELQAYNQLSVEAREALDANSNISDPATNGMIIKESLSGDYMVIDNDTGRIQARGFDNQTQAQEFIDQTNQRIGRDFDGGAGGDLPPVGGFGLPTSSNPLPPNPTFTIPPVGRLARGIKELYQSFNQGVRWLTPMVDHFQALDRTFRTRFHDLVYDPLQRARLQADRKAVPWRQRIESEIDFFIKASGMTDEDLIMVNRYRKARSPEELKKQGGVYRYRGLSESEIKYGEALARGNVDTDKIRRFRELRDAEYRKFAELNNIDVDAIPDDSRRAITDGLATQLGTTPEEMFGVAIFDSIKKLNSNTITAYGVIRLADAIQGNSVSRKDFAKANGMTGQQVELANRIDKLMEDVGQSLGLSDVNLVENYMEFYRSHRSHNVDDIFIDTFRKPGLTGQIAREREFLSKLIKTGDLDVDEPNAFMRLIKFVEAGHKTELIDEVAKARKLAIQMIDESQALGRKKSVAEGVAGVDESSEIPNSLLDISDIERQTDVSPFRMSVKEANVIKRSIDAYTDGILGNQPLTDAFMERVFNRFLDGIGAKGRPDLRRDIVNSFIALTSASALGFRPIMAFRDMAAFFTFHGSQFGVKRSMRGMELALRPGTIKQLRDEGVIPTISHNEFATAEELRASRVGRKIFGVTKILDKVAENGLTASGQKHAFELMHAATYLEMRERVIDVIGDFNAGRITRDEIFTKAKITTLDEAAVRGFERRLNADDIQDAADYAGRVAARQVGFMYGLANSPYGWNTNFGRVAGQFGTWPVFARTFVARGLSTGTRSDRLGFAARFASAQAAMFLTGNFFGLNLFAWYTLPGVMFVGGPGFQLTMDVVNSMRGYGLEKDLAQRNLERLVPFYSRGEMGFDKSYRSILVPGSFLLDDLRQSLQAAEEGRNIFQTTGRAIGIPILRGENWFDQMGR